MVCPSNSLFQDLLWPAAAQWNGGQKKKLIIWKQESLCSAGLSHLSHRSCAAADQRPRCDGSHRTMNSIKALLTEFHLFVGRHEEHFSCSAWKQSYDNRLLQNI